MPLPDKDSTINLNNLQRSIQVYSDVELVRNHLHDKRFQIVENQDDADIIFIKKHFKDFK